MLIKIFEAPSYNRLLEKITFFESEDITVDSYITDLNSTPCRATVFYRDNRAREYPHRTRWYEARDCLAILNFSMIRKFKLWDLYNGGGWVHRQVKDLTEMDKCVLCVPVDEMTYDEIYQVA